ncbi:MAG: ASCH domain-containing protein [Capsulimonadaceae bacterium]
MELDEFWGAYLCAMKQKAQPQATFHLAVFVEPYLSFVLDGRKTVESRFSSRRFPPFDRVARGDVIVLKKSGGPIVGVCRAAEAWSYELDRTTWGQIRDEFTAALCAQDPEFWELRESAAFATLIRIDSTTQLPEIECEKKDRRGWVVLNAPDNQLAMDFDENYQDLLDRHL